MRSLPRWNRPLALSGLFGIVAVLTLSLCLPHNVLLAQQDTAVSPVATPTPFHYVSSLPVCPDDIVNAILTPSVEPTPIANVDGLVLNCLWPSTPMYELDPDSDATGIRTDPDPESALSDPLATPIAPAAIEGTPATTSAPSVQRQPQLYLPLLQNGVELSGAAAELSVSPSPTATIIYADRLNHPYIPIDQLPECEDVTVDGPDYSVPNYYAPQCRARIVASIDIKALYDQGVDLEALGLPRDPPVSTPTVDLARPTPMAEATAFAPAAPVQNEWPPRVTPWLYLPYLDAGPGQR